MATQGARCLQESKQQNAQRSRRTLKRHVPQQNEVMYGSY